MKPFRLVFIGATVAVVLLIVAGAVAFSTGFQTWVTRKALATQPGIHVTVGSVSAGLHHLEVRNLRFEQGGSVVTVPLLEADLPLFVAGWSKKIVLARLAARGWVVDLAANSGANVAQIPKKTGEVNVPVSPSASPLAGGTALPRSFAGIFGRLQLPVDFSIEGLQLEGEIILPESRGRAKVTLSGGDLGSGREGKFDLVGSAALSDPKVNAVTLQGVVTVAMDTPRSFTRVAANVEASATGPQYPAGVKLNADLSATKGATQESYSAAVVTLDRTLLSVRADFPTGAPQLSGTWRVDVRDLDVAPFALGHPLPVFAAIGVGTFETDALFRGGRFGGTLRATADRLAVVRPELSAVGEIKLAADFDVSSQNDAITVQRFNLSLAGARPVAELRALQPFQLEPRTGKLEATDPARELFSLALQGVPLPWTEPLFTGLSIAGGELRGEWIATTRAGGMTLRPKSPLTVNGVSLTRDGRPLFRGIDLSVNASAEYAPQGWQAELNAFTAKQGSSTLVTLEAKAGRLAGGDQALKAAGKISGDLPALLDQPTLNGMLVLSRGAVNVDFVASVDDKREIRAKIAIGNLAADPKVTAEELPEIAAELRADFSDGGKINVHVPIFIERAGRKSDLAVAGTLMTGKDRFSLEAQVTSTNFVFDDAKVLSALLPPAPPPAGDDRPVRDAAPPWTGVSGTVELALKKVVYSDSFEASDVSGTLRIEDGALKLDGVRAGLGEGSDARVNGSLTFDPAASKPYVLRADLALSEFDPAPLFRTTDPAQPPTVEGKFNVSSRLVGHAATLGSLSLCAGSDFHLTSKGGVFRGLPVNVATKPESPSKIAAGAAAIGNMIGAVTGKKEPADIASKSQAVSEFTHFLKAIPYDQLSVDISRDASLNTVLKDFALISPEIRLSGRGQATHQSAAPLLDEALAMEFTLRARGRQAELLKYLGALETQVDDLGYTPSSLPLKVGGTLGKPDATELNSKLAALLVEKSGVTDKAADLYKRLIGGSK